MEPLTEQLLNPKVKFLYTSPKALWQELVQIDFKPSLRLVDYFYGKEKTIENKGKLYFIRPTKKFLIEAGSERSDDAFELLCDLLVRYKKGYRKIHVYIPKHESIAHNECYTPLRCSYEKPIFPELNRKEKRFNIYFEKKLFEEINWYTKATFSNYYPQSDGFSFPYQFFRGFVFY